MQQRNALRAGIFIVVSAALAFAIVVGIKGLGRLFDPIELRTVRFNLKDDLGGLGLGDDLRVGGFKSGEVRNIEIVPSTDPRLRLGTTTAPVEDAYILITVSVPKKYKLREGAHIAVQTTVTGQSALNIDSLGFGKTLALDEPLVGRPGALTALLASFPDIGPKLSSIVNQVNDQTVPGVNGILEDVRGKTVPAFNETIAGYHKTADAGTQLVNDVRGQVKPAADKYHAVADSAKNTLDQAGGIFGDTKSDIRGTMANLNAATGNVKQKLPGILDRVDGVLTKVDSAMTKATEAMEDVKKTAENSRETTAAARSLLVGNRSRIDSMIVSIKSTAENLKNASAEIRRSPWRLLYQPKKEELANLDLFDSARQFAEGANDLSDAAQALRDALKDKQTSPEKLRQLLDGVEKTFSNFNKVETKLWSAVKE
jgi:ABC-type transporter Mla subunit MlaD